MYKLTERTNDSSPEQGRVQAQESSQTNSPLDSRQSSPGCPIAVATRKHCNNKVTDSYQSASESSSFHSFHKRHQQGTPRAPALLPFPSAHEQIFIWERILSIFDMALRLFWWGNSQSSGTNLIREVWVPPYFWPTASLASRFTIVLLIPCLDCPVRNRLRPRGGAGVTSKWRPLQEAVRQQSLGGGGEH